MRASSSLKIQHTLRGMGMASLAFLTALTLFSARSDNGALFSHSSRLIVGLGSGEMANGAGGLFRDIVVVVMATGGV